MKQPNHHYQNSVCKKKLPFLHDYRPLYKKDGGLVEKCTLCGDKQFFPEKIPNAMYLSYHIKQALQPSDRIFKYNWPNFQY